MGKPRKRREADQRCRDFYGIKISELLPHLDARKTHAPMHIPSKLLHLPVVPKGNGPADRVDTPTRALLPDNIQRLSDNQCRRRYHQRSTTPQAAKGREKDEAGAKLERRPECPPVVSPDSFFLPYIAARQEMVHTDSLSSVRDMFQRGALSSQILGVREWSCKSSYPVWPALKKTSACTGVTSVKYFENLKDLQRKLYSGLLWSSAGPQSLSRDKKPCCKTLRTICLKRANNDKSMCCSPPLICRNDIYFTAFTSK